VSGRVHNSLSLVRIFTPYMESEYSRKATEIFLS
jgi:hypothetical protein